MASPNALSKVAAAVSSAYAAWNETGGLIGGICKALNTQYKGEEVPEADTVFICGEVARLRGWTEGTTIRVRKAEMKAIISVYAELPDAVEQLRKNKKNTKPVTFDAALRLARALRKHDGNVSKAIAAYVEGRQATAPEDRTEEQALAAVSEAMKRVLKHTALSKKLRAAITTLCIEHDIAL